MNKLLVFINLVRLKTKNIKIVHFNLKNHGLIEGRFIVELYKYFFCN